MSTIVYYNNILDVKRQFMDDLPTYVAIEELEKLGFTKSYAEQLVEMWELERARRKHRESWS